MKFSLILLICGLAIATAELDKEFVMQFVQKVRKVSEECVGETQASKEDVQSILDHKIPESHEGKCMIFCFHKHFNIQNEDGSLDTTEAYKTHLEPIKEQNREVYNKIITIFAKCAESVATDSDPCIYATNLAECALKEGKAMALDEILVID